jgi:hypothetical protein
MTSSIKKQFFSMEEKNLQCIRYVSSFRRAYLEFLEDKYAILTTIFPFTHGTIIKNQVVKKDQAETRNLDTIFSKQEAFQKANLKKPMRIVSGTKIIVDDKVCYLIKDNGPKEWDNAKVHEDLKAVLLNLVFLKRN